MIELHTKLFPDSRSIADYHYYEETPLSLLLKVNSFRSAMTSCDNTNDPTLIYCNYVEIE